MADFNQTGPASTPKLLLEKQYRALQAQGQEWGENPQLQELDDNAYAEALEAFQTDYDAQLNAITANMETVRQTQEWVDMGLIEPDAGRKAMWETIVPKEIQEAMYPRQAAEPMRAPFSPDQLKTHAERIEEFTKSAKALSPDTWGRNKPPTPPMIYMKYKAWRTNIGYDDMTAAQQRQVDNEWDTDIANRGWDWKPDSGAVRALRGKGPLARSQVSRFRGTLTGPTEAGNPLQANVRSFLPKQPKQQPEQQPAKLSDRDREAISWAKQNPEDPRAAQILTMHGAQ